MVNLDDASLVLSSVHQPCEQRINIGVSFCFACARSFAVIRTVSERELKRLTDRFGNFGDCWCWLNLCLRQSCEPLGMANGENFKE